MVLEHISAEQPVDMAAAQEFMRATLEKIDRAELNALEAEMQQKGKWLRELVAPEALPLLTEEELLKLLRSVFATRRRATEILAAVGAEKLKDGIRELLYAELPVAQRFRDFVDAMTGFFDDVSVLRPRKSSDSRAKRSAEEAALRENVFCDLASELLHFTNPEEYWLWTRWMWDPKTGTGALPLVTMEGVELHGKTVGETYLKLGAAMAFVRATGNAAGFSDYGAGPYGIDVFMACVYAVYLYTTLRLRMTQEFTQLVPQFPELIRRLLGVWRMEMRGGQYAATA